MSGPADYYSPGDHNVICDRTGYKVKASRTVKEWNGSRVRIESFEIRHPQDFLRDKVDRQKVADPRSEGTNTYLATNQAFNALLDPDAGSASASAEAGGGNTGDGAVTGLTADLTASGAYTLSITRVTFAAASDLDPGDNGEFRLTDSGGDIVDFGAIGVAFSGGGLFFTLKENGSTDFVVGDSFTITVT
jgi:hypothetical protein